MIGVRLDDRRLHAVCLCVGVRDDGMGAILLAASLVDIRR